ncbi:putative F-box/LRR-repeat protein At3g18150 isoform X2 [Papaver somniferum]|uniref:putative F-box/LRR-repeat protein At3g18150 isoform X2 n=1 Tax=Papaver somniferum TaxID=3469 RepID=UPI000E703A82|nr:putative F-box/LRR-repeat protein At3g18150 isoform X2 [Papaver somniferum]
MVDPLNTDIGIADALNTWILYAVKREVKELVFVIGVNKSQSFEFPECVFNCESLTDLHLYLGSMYRSTLCLPESIHLPNLKSLKFEALRLYEDLMNDFFTCCPALESVTIRNCIMGDLQIVSHSLKHFTMVYSSFNATVSEVANSVLLFAPNLESFDIKCHPTQLFGLFLKSLVKADVEMVVQEKRNSPYTYSELPGKAKDMFAKAMMLMLEKFRSVKDLTLSSRFIQLRTYLSKDCAQAILYLLRISPKIESLSVRIDKDCLAEQPTGTYCDEINFPSENIEEYWKPGLTSQYEPLHLKVVELVDVNGSVDELRFIEVFLKYAVRLEKLVLYWNWDGSDNLMDRVMKFDEKLRSLPKASSRVSTLFY